MSAITPLTSGISAYRDIAGLAKGSSGPAAGAGAADNGPGFTSALKDAAQSVVDTLREGEQKSAQGVAGQVDIRDVVMAVNNAEVTLQTVVAVRDKVIQAYQDVIDVTRDGLWTAVVVAGPLLLIALVVGLVIGFLQALTQIQEMTLVFVPKMAAIFVGMVLLLPFMITTLSDYMERLSTMIIGID
jgi:flagellar biosynthesis protein FliQ